MAQKKTRTTSEKGAGKYSLVRVYGDIEPEIVTGLALGWPAFESKIVGHLKKTPWSDEDGLFFTEQSPEGHLLDISSFSHGYMVELRALAGDENAKAELESMLKGGWKKRALLWKGRKGDHG